MSEEEPKKIKSEVSNKLLDKKMDCPVCYNNFTTPRVRMPKVRLSSTDTDLRPYYEGIDVVAYEVVVCPACGYSSIFKTFYDVTENTKDSLSKYLNENYKKREWPTIVDTQTAIEKFVLALKCLEAKKANIGEYAYIYLKMGWLFRIHTSISNQEEKEAFCQKKFIETAEQAFAEINFPILDFDETVFLYLIGETCRRVGDYERAYKYIGKVLLDRSTPQKLKERAYDIKALINSERPERVHDNTQ